MNKINRTGETTYDTYGNKMTIIKYINANNIMVEFENGYKTKAKYSQFKLKNIRNPYDKNKYGIGFLGEGIYKVCINRKVTPQYRVWDDMLRRCYSKVSWSKRPTYKGCIVSDEWHNFQNFGKWYEENFYEINNEEMCLDKDILYKGNKIYSPENCIFVPQNINKLFIKSDASRGDCPIGVSYHKGKMTYEVWCQNNKGNHTYLGHYNTSEQAFYVYKEYKEQLIKKIAKEYKDKYIEFPKNLYDAMMRYEVEITD